MAKAGRRGKAPARRAARKRVVRRSRPPQRRGRSPALRPRFVLAALAVAGVLVATMPPVRSAVGRAVDVIAASVEAARYADARLERTARYAARYDIAPDLARDIERAAVAEGIDPDLAFRLIAVESEFHERAVSSAGALGLTQLMPATAGWLQPGITTEQIFERETNLRLGLRYLRALLKLYDGRVDEALHAYNRGPGTVARIRAAGGDPANGYADRVLRPARGDVYTGSGFLPVTGLEPLRRDG